MRLNQKFRDRAMTMAIATPVFIFASIFVAWALASRARKRKAKIQRFPTRSTSIGALHGGKLALHRLADYHEAQENAAALHTAETELKNLLEQEQPDFEQLQVRHFYISILATVRKIPTVNFFFWKTLFIILDHLLFL
jgi:hypothetical protein